MLLFFLICGTQFAGEIVKTMLKLSELVRDPLSPTSQAVSLYEVFNIVLLLMCCLHRMLNQEVTKLVIMINTSNPDTHVCDTRKKILSFFKILIIPH